ncbi:MAG: CRISPR-associated endonuclease Cas1 2 [Chloroflexota bacterium]|nr:CRISPR-associated endonuclease Cas1 [Chloroflexota bacterium]NOG62324.1 CRISPR-associated endonuclease Cas1 [Chloroflexota bacterium]GIK65483.1 MAG: CRISPR-associated endonuclease Cas1 2 [Chloroflexota bacterium]
MTTLYVQHDGCTLTRQDSTLIVRYRENDQSHQQRIPVEKVGAVVIGTGCHITSGAIQLLLSLQVPISFVDYHERFVGALHTPINGNQLLRRQQYQAAENPEMQLYLAYHFLGGKMQNQRTLIQRYARENAALDVYVSQMASFIKSLETVSDIPMMMGYEGQVAKLYFEALGQIFGEAWGFTGRNRRPPRDPINAMLSYGYTVLEAFITSALHQVGLDPYVGFVHSLFPGRKSLALDLLEEFRPVIVDSAVLGLIGNQMLKPADFQIQLGVCLMPEDTRKTFLQRFQQRMDQSVQHPITQEKTTYSRLIVSQARQIGAFLLGDIEGYVPVRIR